MYTGSRPRFLKMTIWEQITPFLLPKTTNYLIREQNTPLLLPIASNAGAGPGRTLLIFRKGVVFGIDFYYLCEL